MPQTTLYAKPTLLNPARPDARPWVCDHDPVWVVDLASRRVIRGTCLTCAVEPGSIPFANAAGTWT